MGFAPALSILGFFPGLIEDCYWLCALFSAV